MINVIIPAAGEGVRFKSSKISRPKPLVLVNGKTLIEHSIDTVRPLKGKIFIVTKKFSKKKNNVLLSEIIYNDPNAVEIFINSKAPHAGAAVSSWYAQWALEGNNLMESPLVIVNCDQILNLDYEDFFNFIKENDPDGAVILYKSSNPKNSFAKIEDGRIVEIIEKDPISEDALVGFHYWKRAKDFFQSTEKLYIKLQPTLHEAYTSETYNFLIKDGKTILPYFIDPDQYISLGTPEDIDLYMGSGEWRGQQDG